MEKAPPLVLLGGADAHDLVLVEMLIDDYPNIIFVVLTSLNPIIPLRPSKKGRRLASFFTWSERFWEYFFAQSISVSAPALFSFYTNGAGASIGLQYLFNNAGEGISWNCRCGWLPIRRIIDNSPNSAFSIFNQVEKLIDVPIIQKCFCMVIFHIVFCSYR